MLIGLAFWVITTSSDELNEFLKGELPKDAVASSAELLLDCVLVVSKITVKVRLDVPAVFSPVDGTTSNDEAGSEVDSQRVEGSNIKSQSGNLNLALKVEEENCASGKPDVGGRKFSESRSSQVTRWEGFLSQWTGINVSLSTEGGITLDQWNGNVEGNGENLKVDGVAEGGQSFGNEVLDFAS